MDNFYTFLGIVVEDWYWSLDISSVCFSILQLDLSILRLEKIKENMCKNKTRRR